MGYATDVQVGVGYQEINPVNLFDKQISDPVPKELAGMMSPAESPKERYLKTHEFKHLPKIQQEFMKNLPTLAEHSTVKGPYFRDL